MLSSKKMQEQTKAIMLKILKSKKVRLKSFILMKKRIANRGGRPPNAKLYLLKLISTSYSPFEFSINKALHDFSKGHKAELKTKTLIE